MGGPDDNRNLAQDPHLDDGAATRHREEPLPGGGGEDLSQPVAPEPEDTSGESADERVEEGTESTTESTDVSIESADEGTDVGTDEGTNEGTNEGTVSTENTADVVVVAEQERTLSTANESVSAIIQSPGNEDEPEVLVVAEAASPSEPMVVTETIPPVEVLSSTQDEAVTPLEGTTPDGPLPPEGASRDQPTAPPALGDVADGSVPPQKVATRAPSDPGKIVEGVVTAVGEEGVELTLDDGRPAYISRRNFGLNDESPETVLSVGDRAYGAELRREDPKSRVVLSRSWALKKQAWDKVVDASTEGKLVTGRVVSGNKKGVVVDAGVRGFVPMSHFELEPVADLTPFIGQLLEFKVIEIDTQKEKLVLSRRSFLLKEQRKQTQEFINGIKPGEVRTGKISSFADYGAFVDLGGVNGLAHISELSWDRVAKPSDVLSIGQEVEVKVLDVKAKKKRISLSLRQTKDDPLSGFVVGSVLSGPVTRLVDFGAFVLVAGFEGLVHLSELAEYRVSAPEEIVTPGDVVGVKVLSIDSKRRRLELSIRQAAEYQG